MAGDEPKSVHGAKVTTTGRQTNMSLAALLMMVGLLLSKVTGQLREILVIYVFGGNTVLSDAYFLGFQIPDLFYQLLIGGAIQAAITPTLAAAIQRRETKDGWRSVSIFINIFSLAVILAILIGELLAPVLIPLYNPTKDPAVVDLAISVSQALFPQVFFMMMAAMSIGILNAYQKFRSTAFGPAFYNICVIIAMVLLGSSSAAGPIRVAAGVMLAASLFFLLQFFLARREFSNYVFSFDFKDQGFIRLLKLAIPTLISGSIVQLNMIILTRFAGEDAQMTALRNASTTWQLPYGIFAIAIGSVMLPSLSSYFAVKKHNLARKLYTRSIRSALFMIVPFSALFLVMKNDVIRAIFKWGSSYSEDLVALAGSLLGWYCLAMVAQTVVFMTNQAFYARKMTIIALGNGILTMGLNYVLNLGLQQFRPGDISNLSLAYTITSLVSMMVLYTLYKKTMPEAAPRRIWPYAARLLVAAIALIAVVVGLSALPVHPNEKIVQLLWLALRSLTGFAAFIGLSLAMGLHEARQVLEKIQQLASKFGLYNAH